LDINLVNKDKLYNLGMTFHHATLCKAHNAMTVRVSFWSGDAMEHNTQIYSHILFWKLVHVFFVIIPS